MNKKTRLYIPLLLLLLLTAGAFIPYSVTIFRGLSRVLTPGESVRIPFDISRGRVGKPLPEGEEAGLQRGDIPLGINGNILWDDNSWQKELYKLKVGDPVTLTVERQGEDGKPVRLDLSFTGRPIEMSIGQIFLDFSVMVLFSLLLPLLSFLLGFYVAFVRPRDPQAWLLLMVLLCVGSIPMEGRQQSGGYTYFFQQTLINSWGIWMLLFAVYFPERWKTDEKYPWAKWILLAPLSAVAILNFFEQLGRLFDWRALWQPIDNLTRPYDNILTVLAMTATGLFFAILGIKSGTLENKDSRRRLRILYFGTSAAMIPALIVVLSRIIRGVEGGFFDLVPAWFAIYALTSILLFPMTMAYVIVVQRAMDVRVVIRQGLQYALAKNGVLALQILLSFIVIMAAASFVTDAGTNRPMKITFIALGITGVFLIRLLADKIKTWTDRRFFREAYNAEQILSELSENVRTMVETKPLLETVSQRISESLHVPQVTLLLKTGNFFQPAYALGYDDAPSAGLDEDGRTIGKLRKNQPIVIYQDDEDSWVDEPAEERTALRELNSQLLLPVGAKNQLSGVISLSPKMSEEPYSPNDLRLLKSVAVQTGLALENSRLTEAIAHEAAQKERLNRELEIAREVQERLFPQDLPAVEGLEYYGACRPALGVGGDYYDFIELEGGKFGIAIGDVSGKGIGASLMMASLQATLRGQAIHSGDDLAGLMGHVNRLIYETSTTNRYATFFYAQYDPKTRKLIYVNAGHNPPYVIRRGENGLEVIELKEGGAVVGMLPPMLVNYTQGEIDLQPGDLLVGSTDGITEAMNPNEEEWGEDSALDELKTMDAQSCREILEHIVAAADRFAAGAKQHDDMTMIVVRVNERKGD